MPRDKKIFGAVDQVGQNFNTWGTKMQQLKEYNFKRTNKILVPVEQISSVRKGKKLN